ncbi:MULTISPECIES: DMT family transporter [unclassified Roseovarius]|uniref:DMT family transporter n=1 Tax=unclassified Roseovarius TaxID=2614913 RepID=UPI00273FDDD6|nr:MULTISPECIES: DMT family transporter [unclassified Roseovarius]
MDDTKRTLLAHAAAATAALSAGTAVVATRFVVGDVDPISLAFWRYLIGSACFLPVLPMLWPSHRLSVRDVGTIAILGLLFFCLFTWGFNAALDVIPAARGAVGLATVPIQTLIVAALFGREAMSRRKIGAVALAFAGVAVVFGPSAFGEAQAGAWRGDVYMLAGVFCAALYSVFSRSSLRAHGPLFVTALAMMFGAAALLALSLFTSGGPDWPALDPSGWAALVFLGTFAGAVQFALFTWALRWLPPSTAVIYIALNPITAVVLGGFLLGEAITPLLLLGLALVMSGIALSSGMLGRGRASS